jgi:hydroxypyruvate isomerase
VDTVIEDHAADFGHIQIADAPGRGEPGTGDLPLGGWVQRSRDLGYEGHVGLEYKTTAADPFAWLPEADRG